MHIVHGIQDLLFYRILEKAVVFRAEAPKQPPEKARMNATTA
ncbi:hypothetical protein HM1_1925 [Heliomicrobium modesticaldum Ice1]|uniref:Uncharacterized protein n=1 Tax=Heliobacterium modesticaldum (strain ATCC 51547 / Ice1) TaxID=498761 RepID=B0TFQ4_HELMI|nr:hypothetical protein HM1_1925 [Heliomicrobium modesticaldum Ice1]